MVQWNWLEWEVRKKRIVTHDPLCAKSPTGVHYIGVCTCDLIAKVRADQRECCVAVIEEVAKDTSDPQLLIAAILEKA